MIDPLDLIDSLLEQEKVARAKEYSAVKAEAESNGFHFNSIYFMESAASIENAAEFMKRLRKNLVRGGKV